MNEGLASGRRLTLISASAGFGKTTLVSEWIAGCGQPVAWLSLDAGDNDPTCFLTYLVAALQTVAPSIGEGILGILRATPSQPPNIELLLTTLLNELITISDNFILVLDDYHVIETQSLNRALTFLIGHLPPQLHLVIATREDPQLPLARLRVRGQLTELRAADLRFTPAEAAEFLNQGMGLRLSAENIAALEARTEGWIAGLQLAALSMLGQQDTAGFIRSFTGSHHFVLDYLVEEVLQQQSESVQTFLLHTSVLDRLCGSLCDAVLLDPSAFGQENAGQETLEYLERSNLFIVPLDDERHWYRYHHLFADLLRQRLRQSTASSAADGGRGVAELHQRASIWCEDNGLDIEAFQHAAAAHEVERAERLIDGKGLQTHLRGVAAILDWLASLPAAVLDARPSLWVRYASALLVGGQTTGVEEKLQAAEAAIAAARQGAEPDDKTRDLIGQIAAARAILALSHYETETMIAQASRALEYLHPDNLSSRFRANLTLASAYQFRGERAETGRAYAEALSVAEASGNVLHISVAILGLGQIQESENQLSQAAEAYGRSLELLSDPAPPIICEAYFGLARICYERNDLDAAEQYGQRGLRLARQYDREIDIFVICEVFLARLKLAQGDLAGAAGMLAETSRCVQQRNYVQRKPEVAAAQVLVLLRQGDLAAAAELATAHELPTSQARVHLARRDPSAALAVLGPYRQQVEARNWQDERLRVMVLQVMALYAHGEKDRAVQLLGEALARAEPGGFIRLFVDEGEPMRTAISDFRTSIEKQPRGRDHRLLGYAEKLLAAFAQPAAMPQAKIEEPKAKMLEPLSPRELEILQLIAQGLSNGEIGARLFLALDTVKGHNRRIFDKLEVQSRTEALARVRELGLFQV